MSRPHFARSLGEKAAGERAQKVVDKWNKAHPVGTKVRIWPGIREGDGIETATKSAASVLGAHTAVVWTEARPDCIALSHVKVI